MDDDRERGATEPSHEAVEAGGVVEVAVAQHDRLDLGRVHAEAVHVRDHPVRARAGVEEDAVSRPGLRHRHQRGEAVLRHQGVGSGRSLHRGDRPRPHQTRPLRHPLVREEQVGRVVHEREDLDRLDGLEGDHRSCVHLVEDP